MTTELLNELKSILPADLYRLVSKSHDPNERQPKSLKTTLHFMAVACDDLHLYTNMISLGANVNLEDANGMTPLILAVQMQNSTALTDLLIAAGADVNHVDAFQMTPLIKASIGKAKHEIVRSLIHAGADLHFVDATGRTALDWAKDKRTRRLLRDHGCLAGSKARKLP